MAVLAVIGDGRTVSQVATDWGVSRRPMLSEFVSDNPSDGPRQEQQVGRFLSIFEERLARRA